MNGARMSTLASLRGSIERIETHGDVHGLNRRALGHEAADAMLCGGGARPAGPVVFAPGHPGAAAQRRQHSARAQELPVRPLTPVLATVKLPQGSA